MSGRDRDARRTLGEKNVNFTPEQVIRSASADVPGARARVVSVRRIVLAPDFLPRGIPMDPSDVTGSRQVFYDLDISAAGLTAADQHEVSVLVGGVEISDLRNLSQQAVAYRLGQRQPVAKRAVAQRIAKDPDCARGGGEVSGYFRRDPLL